MARALFFLLAFLSLVPLVGLAGVALPGEVVALVAPAALIGGLILALTLGNPFPAESKKVSKPLLQAAVVLLGFSVDFHTVLQAGVKGLGFAVVSILAVYGLGWLLQRGLKVRPTTSLLVSTGTAICGGSAIAAMSSVVNAESEDVSVAVGTVFLLNAAALILFPPLGHALGLTPGQFGVWAGIAIHDVSSVVGAATAYGGGALDTATAVKLSRVLYLVPITLVAAMLTKKTEGKSVPIPWFVGGFLLAAFIRSLFPFVAAHATEVKSVASAGFALCLFLIGAGISRKALAAVGWRPMAQGIILWVTISVLALFAAKAG